MLHRCISRPFWEVGPTLGSANAPLKVGQITDASRSPTSTEIVPRGGGFVATRGGSSDQQQSTTGRRRRTSSSSARRSPRAGRRRRPARCLPVRRPSTTRRSRSASTLTNVAGGNTDSQVSADWIAGGMKSAKLAAGKPRDYAGSCSSRVAPDLGGVSVWAPL
jgi:hypothetical protein